jgi:hypothetical protein
MQPRAPRLFKREIGELIRVEGVFPVGGDFIPTKATGSAGQKRGIRYENNVCKYLSQRFDFVNQIVFEFDTRERKRQTARPDGLIIASEDHYVIVEVKTIHSEDAYYQLQFYKKILEKYLPENHFSLLEICAEYNPSVKLPSGKFILEDLDLVKTPSFGHNVYILTEKTLKLLVGGLKHGLGRDNGAADAALRAGRRSGDDSDNGLRLSGVSITPRTEGTSRDSKEV